MCDIYGSLNTSREKVFEANEGGTSTGTSGETVGLNCHRQERSPRKTPQEPRQIDVRSQTCSQVEISSSKQVSQKTARSDRVVTCS